MNYTVLSHNGCIIPTCLLDTQGCWRLVDEPAVIEEREREDMNLLTGLYRRWDRRVWSLLCVAIVSVLCTLPSASAAESGPRLSSLDLSGIDIGVFDADTTSYAGSVHFSVVSTTVTAQPADSTTTVTVTADGRESTSRPGTVYLSAGVNNISIVVSDGSSETTYTVAVTRRARSNVATLASLEVPGHQLRKGLVVDEPGGVPNRHRLVVPHEEYMVSVDAVPTDPGATVEITPADFAPDVAGHQVHLRTGVHRRLTGWQTSVDIKVTSHDGSASKTYDIELMRASHIMECHHDSKHGWCVPRVRHDEWLERGLSGLELSGIDFGTFETGTYDYTAHIRSNVTTTDVTAVPTESTAAVSFNLPDADAEAPGYQLEITEDHTRVVATVADGDFNAVYTVTLIREVTIPDANLRAEVAEALGFDDDDPIYPADMLRLTPNPPKFAMVAQ